jgi:ceramide glucosyltransferase
MATIATLLFGLAAAGLLVLFAQWVVLVLHTRGRDPEPAARPAISILKPLCGVDDDLAANLEAFAAIDWAEYEVLLGIADARDPALEVARAAAARWPRRFRVVLQRGAPGTNPKVNQLVTLARAARHDILVVSDSNVRVARGYLAGIAGHLEDDGVGLVTHLVAGAGERSLGSLLDALHLAGGVAPAVAAAKRLAGHDIVVGKSMAFRRSDLDRLGGFAAAKDVLAEDYVLGRRVSQHLGKRVALAHAPVVNTMQAKPVAEFLGRYRRWAVLQRQMAGAPLHAAQILMNPAALASAALALSPCKQSLFFFVVVCAGRAALDGACARRLRPGGFAAAQLLLVPLKDLLFAAAWAHGLLHDEVVWRGKRLRVLPGTRIARPRSDDPAAEGAAAGIA